MPPTEANGLKTISSENCLSPDARRMSFFNAGFHLFAGVNLPLPKVMADQETGVFLCILSFVHTKKVWRQSGAQPRGPECFWVDKEKIESTMKMKATPAGVARQQLHFLCVDKENGSKRKRPERLPVKVNHLTSSLVP